MTYAKGPALDLYAKLQLRGIAAGLGAPEYLLTGDLSNANYSSLRAGLLEFRRRVEAVQFQIIVPQVLSPLWHRFVTSAVLAGELDAPDFEASAADYFACEWIPPAQEWIDPEKDAKATGEMISAGLSPSARPAMILPRCMGEWRKLWRAGRWALPPAMAENAIRKLERRTKTPNRAPNYPWRV